MFGRPELQTQEKKVEEARDETEGPIFAPFQVQILGFRVLRQPTQRPQSSSFWGLIYRIL